jgi:hypothetical protein
MNPDSETNKPFKEKNPKIASLLRTLTSVFKHRVKNLPQPLLRAGEAAGLGCST